MEKRTSCSVCRAEIECGEGAVLAVGGFGTPRFICDGCAADFDAATTEKEVGAIDAAIDRISKKMTASAADDDFVLVTVDALMKNARERREKIRLGEYDFSLDEVSESENGVPEELLESEEDIQNEKIEAEKNAKYEKITNIVCAILAIGALGFVIYEMIMRFFI